MDRIKKMETDSVVFEEDRIFAEKLERNKRECDEKTQKNAEKRKRKKMKKTTAKKMSNNGVKAVDGDDDEDAESDVEEIREIVVAKPASNAPKVAVDVPLPTI